MIRAMSIYSEMMNIDRFPGLNELTSFVGLVPEIYSSGEKENVLGLSNNTTDIYATC
jgi:hypothetical protein